MNKLVTIAAAMAISSTAVAATEVVSTPVVSGSVSVEMTDTLVAPTVELNVVSAVEDAVATITVETTSTSTTMTGYDITMPYAGLSLSLGNNADLFEAVTGKDKVTLSAVTTGDTSVSATSGDIGLLVGIDANATINNVSFSTSVLGLDAAYDFNVDTSKSTYAVASTATVIDIVSATTVVTYGDSQLGYQLDLVKAGASAYVAGIEGNLLDTVGTSYEFDVSALNVVAAVDYTIDSKSYSPSLTLSHSF